MKIYYSNKLIFIVAEWLFFTLISISVYSVAIREKLSLISGFSEYFAYSWVFGLRLNASEAIPFCPHSQILFLTFNIINRLFGLSEGNPEQIIKNWEMFAYIYTVTLVFISTTLIAWFNKNENAATRIICLALYFILVPYYLSDQTLFSTSYHSAAIPAALSSLIIWKIYFNNNKNWSQYRLKILLIFYTVICALIKPTFVVYSIPLWVLEFFSIAGIVNFKEIRKEFIFQILPIVSMCAITICFYLLFFWVYLGSVKDVEAYFNSFVDFSKSQAHWYDHKKLETPFHWFYNYVIVEMRYISLIPFSIFLLFIIKIKNNKLTIAFLIGLFLALFFLYSRSYRSAEPEFISYLLVMSVIQINQLFANKNFIFKNFCSLSYAFLSIITAILLSFFLPLNAVHTQFIREMTLNDEKVRKVVFGNQEAGVTTLILSKYPEVLFGSIDAICRGGQNIFFNFRSPTIDTMFADGKGGGVTCFGAEASPNFVLNSAIRIIFRVETNESLDEAISRHLESYQILKKYDFSCVETQYILIPANAKISECNGKLKNKN